MSAKSAATTEEVLSQELRTLARSLDELLRTAPRQYVLIKGTNIIGTYTSERAAVEEGTRRYLNAPFLVHEFRPDGEPISIPSPLGS